MRNIQMNISHTKKMSCNDPFDYEAGKRQDKTFITKDLWLN